MDPLETLRAALAGRYRLVSEVGRGGMALVYLAEDVRHSRQVAIKVLRPDLAASLGGDRFLREISVAAGLQHPNILPLYDSGALDVGGAELLYYVMPYVDGESLRARMDRERHLPIDEALIVAREVLGALGHAHAHGIIHRDIKPENILLSGGHALVVDFGIARAIDLAGEERLTETGLAIGTPAYMSPEQASAERGVDARSDLYSLACVLYEMLTGEPPFTGATAQALLLKRLTETPFSAIRLRETIPIEVDAALHRGLARVPADRFPTAAAFSDALRPGSFTPGGTPAPVVVPGRRSWLIFGGALLAAVLAGVVWVRRPPAEVPLGRLVLTDLIVARADSSTDYLRIGIPEYLVTALLRLPGLEVTPMSLVRRESDVASPVDLGKKLGAVAVLTGRLDKFGGNLMINAELVQIPDGRLLWSGQFQYPDSDYAGLIPAVVAVIADSLRLQLSAGARQEVLARSTVDPVVLDLLLRAGHGLEQGIAGAVGDSVTIDSTRVLYERVLERSPHNAQALAGRGFYYTISYIRGWNVPGLTPSQAYVLGDSLIRAALALDSTILNAWAMLSINRLFLEDDFEGAREAIDRVVRLDPGYPEIYRSRGILRQEVDGQLPAALGDFRRAVELAPSVLRLNSLAAGLMAGRRYPEAVAVLERSMAMRPSGGAWTRLITAYERMGRRADAVRIRRLVEPTGASAAPFEMALAANDTAAYTRARRSELRRSADSLIARLDRADVVPAERYNVAELRIGAMLCELGDSKQAVDLVQNLYQIRPARLRWIVTNVDLGCLRQDPRYLPMVKQAGLEPYLRN